MSTKIRISQQSRYAPIRYEATRPYAHHLGRFSESADGLDQERHGAFVFQQLFPLVKAAVERLGTPEGPGPTQAENTNVQIFGGYQRGGRVIYDVSRPLAAALSVTDADEIPCGELTFPSGAFYLHFGVGTGLRESGMEIEGVFVRRMTLPGAGARLLVDAVRVGQFAVRDFWRLPLGEAMTGISMSLNNDSEPVLSALDRAITETIAQNQEILDQYREVERNLSAQYGQVVKVPSPVENLADKRDLLRCVMHLVVNTLFFLTAEAADVREEWDNDAPAELLEQTHAEKFGTRKTAENTLAARGYVKVRYVGRHYAETVAARDLAEAVSPGRQLPTHLRRGHFRSQPYGLERAFRKIIFIAPVIVNPGRGEPVGRIYQV